jgi:ParB family chromosome partitioning protein
MTQGNKSEKPTRKKKPQNRGLGRGLSALMSDINSMPDADFSPKPSKDKALHPSELETEGPDVTDRRVQFVSIDKLERNADQPRRYFDKEKLSELTESIKSKGVLQPILVRPLPGGKLGRFQIVAGERRWQASTAAGLTTMPVLIRDLNDEEILQIGVIENVQRADLNPIEEAKAYDALITQFYRKQDEVAEAVGKSRSYITNMLRLLKLPELAQGMLATGKITTGHARAIISAPDPSALAREISEKSLSVREAEDWVRRIKKSDGRLAKARRYKDADTQSVEKGLTETLGLKVDLDHRGSGGVLKIFYKKNDQLEALIKKLSKSE